MTDAITIQNPRNRGGSTGHVLAKRSVTFTEIRIYQRSCFKIPSFRSPQVATEDLPHVVMQQAILSLKSKRFVVHRLLIVLAFSLP